MSVSEARTGLWLMLLDGRAGSATKKCIMCGSYLVQVTSTTGLADRLSRIGRNTPDGAICVGKIRNSPCPRSLFAKGVAESLQAVTREVT